MLAGIAGARRFFDVRTGHASDDTMIFAGFVLSL